MTCSLLVKFVTVTSDQKVDVKVDVRVLDL